MDDVELLRRYAEEGSEEAFAELVQRHVNLVYSAALRRVGDDAHLAKDVTQKVFIALARQAPSLTNLRTLTGWLYTTSRFAAAQVVRTEQRRKAREQKAYIMNETSAEAAPDPEWDRVRPALDGVMDQLNKRDREALLLRYFSGCAFAEVGLSLGLSEDAARKRVDRALEKLRALLAKRGVASSSAAVASMLGSNAVTAAPASFAASVPAIAVASAANIGAFSLLQFFTSTKLGIGAASLIGLAAILDIPAIGTAIYQLRAAHRAEASLATASHDYQAKLQELRAAASAAGAAESERAALLRAATAASSSALDPRAEGRKFLAEFPQARAMLVRTSVAGAKRTNGSFYRLAGFTPTEVDAFERQLAESSVDNLEVTPTSLTAAGQLSDDQLSDLMDQQAFVKFHNYSQIAEAYAWTGMAARELNFAGTPLTSDQTDQLALILANNSSLYRSGKALNAAFVDENSAMASVDWDTALSQARDVLSPAQWQTAQPVLLSIQLKGALHQAGEGQASATALK